MMEKEDAILLAGKCEDWLNIPSLVCEIIEGALREGRYEDVCKFMVQRIKEIER